MMQNPGYIFGGDTGETAESLARKRAIAQRMVAGSGSAPRNVGEGIARIGEALAGAYIGRKANDAQKKGEAEAAEAFASIFGGMSGGALGAGANAAGATATMPANTSPGIIETQPLPAPSGYSEDAARGALSDYDEQLAQSESSGNYGALNSEGYGGKYQFGEARLQDYKTATGRDFTMEEFLANPQLQEEVQAWHNADIDGFAQEQGVPFGSEVGGVPLTPTSFRGMAHLGGKQGALKFVQSGGEYNPADSNGTRLSDYGSRFAGAAAAQPVNAAPAPSPQPSGPDQARIAQIAQVMQHPFINPAQRAIAEQLLQAELAKAQPAMTPYQQAQLDLAQRRLEAQLSGQIGGQNITVNTGGEPSDSALRKKLDEKTGEAWSKLENAGAVSAASMQDFQVLDELIKIAPQGPLTGRLAEMFPGFSSAGAAFESIVKRIAPTLRAEGSGATSDIEYDGMLRSLPMLRNKPEANQLISAMMQAKAQINIERADIVNAYSRGDMTAAEARRQISEINKRSIMSPELETLIKGVDNTERGGGTVIDGYTIEEVE